MKLLVILFLIKLYARKNILKKFAEKKTVTVLEYVVHSTKIWLDCEFGSDQTESACFLFAKVYTEG